MKLKIKLIILLLIFILPHKSFCINKQVIIGDVAFNKAVGTKEIYSIEITTIGCFINNKFLDGIKCQYFVKKGAKFILYILQSGKIGSGEITNIPAASNEPPDDGTIYFKAKTITKEKIKKEKVLVIFDDSFKLVLHSNINNNKTTYKKIIKEYLAKQNIKIKDLIISQIIAMDINNDKNQEIFLNFRSKKDYLQTDGHKDDFSNVLMQYIDKNKNPKLVEIYKQIFTGNQEESYPPETREIIAFYDLNKDGILEVITSGAYYEGDGFDIYEFKNNIFKIVSSWWQGV